MLRKLVISLTVVLVLVYYLYTDYRSRIDSIRSVSSSFKISTLNIPEIKTKLEHTGALSTYSIWDLDLKKLGKEKPVTEEGEVFYQYEVKKFGKNEAVVRVGDEDKNNRWELQGIVKKNSKVMAVFYNPSKKKIKLVSKGEVLEDSLTVEEIEPNLIVVKYPKSKNEYETLKLKVFYVDLEAYKKKKKR